MSKTEHTHITLIGEEQENFYELGLKDKDAYEVLEQSLASLCSKSPAGAKFLKYASELAISLSKKDYLLKNQIASYARGLGVSSEKVFLNLFLPELVSSFNKWTPDILSFIPGCSSAFFWDKENEALIHTRILDYPLGVAFDLHQRSINYKLDAQYKIYSHGVAGMPFPGLTSMNEKGLSLALHYKHSDYLNLSGQSIFSICYQILKYCSKVSEIKKFLRSYQSITSWGIYLSDSDGEVCSVDIKGDEVSVERFDLKEAKTLYFNNRTNSSRNKSLPPFGNLNQCMMRKESAQEKIQNIKPKSSLLTQSLKALCTLDEHKSNHAINWKLNPITPASIQAISLCAKTQSSQWINTASPKIYQGSIVEHSQIFDRIETINHKNDYSNTPTFIKGQHYISQFQISLDRAEIEKAYHNIQMALVHFKEYPEYYIYTFYFLVLEYIFERDKKDLSFIYKELLTLKNKLPKYLEDHRLLFLLRLEIRLRLPISDSSESFSNIDLLKLYDKEKKLSALKLELLKKLIFPRIEILDILYIY